MEANRTLLIVDDEPETLKGYEEFLTPPEPAVVRKTSRKAATAPSAAEKPGSTALSVGEKYNLLLARSGEEAVKLVETEIKAGRRVAAGFFDVKLEGGMDGLATIHAIKTMDRDIHCVVVTAYHDRSVEEINQIFGEEFKDQWDYLNKPFTQGEIVQKARQMIGAWNRRRQIEEMNSQLVRSERLAGVGQVARGIGHEFGNILLRIIGKTDLALLENDTAKIHAHLQVVITAAERAGVIVRNLQSFSRTEPNFQPAPLTAPLDESISLVNHEFVKHSIKLEKNYKTGNPVRMDVGSLGQVFLNLLINATHSMLNGGVIRVTVEDAPNPNGDKNSPPGVAARIADSGTGIPDHVLPRIFDFAFTTKGDRGSGLGLSVSKEIVEAHGGSITVKTQVGNGTEFTVWIPRA